MTDVWKDLAGQENAKWAIEIAMVGGLPITFVPCEGSPYRFTSFDVGRLCGEHRERMQAIMDKYDGDPMSATAARDTVALVREAAAFLAERCGLSPINTLSDGAAMRIDISPTSMADLLLPPPAESVDRVAFRVLEAIERLPRVPKELSYEAARLLDKWTDAAPHAPYYDAIQIARCIAAHNGNDGTSPLFRGEAGLSIGRLCLAEAISYCRP